MTEAQPTLLGLDVGTSAIKAAVLDREGRSLAVRSVPTPFIRSEQGWTQMSVPALFEAVHELVSLLTPELRAIRGIGIASLGESGGWVQGDTVAEVPVLVWHDPRGQETSDRLVETFGQPDLLRRTGRRSRSDLGVSKMGWLADQGVRPDGVWTGVAGLLVWHLTGALAQEPSLAATSGAFDPYRCRYDQEILAVAGLDVRWAPLVTAGTPLGTITAARAAETGLPAGIPVTIAGHDHPVGVLGAGGRPGMVVDSMGTGEPLVAAWTGGAPATHPELTGVPGDLTITRWPGDDALMILWEHIRPGLALRHLAAALDVVRDDIERAALDQPRGRPTPPRLLAELEVGRVRLADLSSPVGGRVDPARIWADVLDGYAAAAAAGEAGLRQLTGSTGPSLLIGGGVQSRRWVQAKQDLQTHGLVVAQDKDSVARGAALMGGAATGWWPAERLPRQTVELGSAVT